MGQAVLTGKFAEYLDDKQRVIQKAQERWSEPSTGCGRWGSVISATHDASVRPLVAEKADCIPVVTR